MVSSILLLQLFTVVASQAAKSDHSITFRVCEKTPEKYNFFVENVDIFPYDDDYELSVEDRESYSTDNYDNGDHAKILVSKLTHYKKNKCSEYLSGTKFSQRSRASINNGFVNTVINSYSYHHNLIIRPDDVWLAIMIQFSLYINANSEKFRRKFVNFEGRKQLTVSGSGSLRTASYDTFVNTMTEKIDDNISDKQFKNWILPNFTTTTKDDLVTSGIVFMATFKKYFLYGFELMCGIPWVTLEGSVEDWLEILNRLEGLKKYDLEKWYDMLEPVLQQFVEARRGNPDLEFWRRIAHESGASGAPAISGWITTFCVFSTEGKWQADFYKEEQLNSYTSNYKKWPKLDADKIPSGIAEVDVNIAEGAKNYSAVLFGGHMAFEVLDDKTLRPLIGWALALKSDETETHKTQHKNN